MWITDVDRDRDSERNDDGEGQKEVGALIGLRFPREGEG